MEPYKIFLREELENRRRTKKRLRFFYMRRGVWPDARYKRETRGAGGKQAEYATMNPAKTET